MRLSYTPPTQSDLALRTAIVIFKQQAKKFILYVLNLYVKLLSITGIGTLIYGLCEYIKSLTIYAEQGTTIVSEDMLVSWLTHITIPILKYVLIAYLVFYIVQFLLSVTKENAKEESKKLVSKAVQLVFVYFTSRLLPIFVASLL